MTYQNCQILQLKVRKKCFQYQNPSFLTTSKFSMSKLAVFDIETIPITQKSPDLLLRKTGDLFCIVILFFLQYRSG